MTDYTDRDDTNLGVGRIWTSPTAYALYNNPIAITEGALGAPRVQGAAINWASVVGSIGGIQLQVSIVGNYVDSNMGNVRTSNTIAARTYTKEVLCLRPGSYRAQWGVVNTDTTASIAYEVQINGSNVATGTQGNVLAGGDAQKTHDITVSSGDIVRVSFRPTNSNSLNKDCTVDCALMTGNPTSTAPTRVAP